MEYSLIYCSPYSKNNLIYPFPIIYLKSKGKLNCNLYFSQEDISYLEDLKEYEYLIQMCLQDKFRFEVFWINAQMGEKYGLESSEKRAIKYLTRIYGKPKRVIDTLSDTWSISLLCNVLYHWLKRMYLERYLIYDDLIHLTEHEGRLTDDHLEVLKNLKYIPDFYRKVKINQMLNLMRKRGIY